MIYTDPTGKQIDLGPYDKDLPQRMGHAIPRLNSAFKALARAVPKGMQLARNGTALDTHNAIALKRIENEVRKELDYIFRAGTYDLLFSSIRPFASRNGVLYIQEVITELDEMTCTESVKSILEQHPFIREQILAGDL